MRHVVAITSLLTSGALAFACSSTIDAGNSGAGSSASSGIGGGSSSISTVVSVASSSGAGASSTSTTGPGCPPGQTVLCYSGAAGTEGVGPCKAGTSTCKADWSGYGPCVDQVLPTKETCNLVDDDCNGLVDDGIECCSDGVKNGDEEDIDCGGSFCIPCSLCGCASDADCSFGSICIDCICVIVDCPDGVQNGDETDIDCGGTSCGPCTAGKKCKVATDCLSNACVSGICG